MQIFANEMQRDPRDGGFRLSRQIKGNCQDIAWVDSSWNEAKELLTCLCLRDKGSDVRFKGIHHITSNTIDLYYTIREHGTVNSDPLYLICQVEFSFSHFIFFFFFTQGFFHVTKNYVS